MKKLKNNIAIILVLLAIATILGGFGYLDYYIWRLQHPQAPGWTWLFSHKN